MAGRIRIPPYKPTGINAQGIPTGGYYDIDAHAGIFNSLPPVQLGLQVAQGAVGIAGAVSPYLGSDNEAAVKAADTKLGETEQTLLFDPQTGYLNLQGEAALQRAPVVLDAYSEAQARTFDAAADDDQRRMLQELADKRLASFNEVVERHGAAQRQSWYDQVADQRIAAMKADAALHWNSDALLRRALGTVRAEVRERAARKGWDSPLTESTLSDETSRVLASAIRAAVDRDPDRARSLRTRYAAVIEDNDRAALDALLVEAQKRERAQAVSTEILNAAPPEGHHPTPQWRVRQADAITDPEVRDATIRRLNSAAAAAEARARALGEQVLARVLNDGLTDPSQIPVSEWVALDAVRRQAIETRLDHNAAGTEPAPNPALVDELATQMAEAVHDFARRDLVPEIAHLPMPQWQRFRDWQTGLRRSDPATEDEVYAIRRGLQIIRGFQPERAPARDSDESSPSAADVPRRAALVEEIDTTRKVTGKSPDDAVLRAMVRRSLPDAAAHNVAFPYLDPRTARHLARLPGQVLDELTLFMIWLLMNGMALKLKPDEMLFPRRAPAPKPDEGWPSTPRSPAPNVPEVQTGSDSARSRGSMPSDIDKPRSNRTGTPHSPTILKGPNIDTPWPPTILKGPEIGAFRPPTVLPGADIDAPRMPTILKGPETDAPRMPTILAGPDVNATQLPTIYASQGVPANNDEEWEAHHHIPQELWAEGRLNRLPFRSEVIDYFKRQTVWLPKDEHWDYLHKAYNREFRKAFMDYLAKHKKDGETEQDVAARMTKEEACKAYRYVVNTILNLPEALEKKDVDDATHAREFMDNVSWYVRQQHAAKAKEVAK